MKRRAKITLVLGGFAALMTLVAVTVAASGGGLPGAVLAHFGHGGPMSHHHQHMAELVQELELDDRQRQHIEAIHDILMDRWTAVGGQHEAHLTALIERREGGELDVAEARQVVDQHLDALRHMAYGVSDQLVALANGLDARQRDTLLEHLRQARSHVPHRGHGSHGH